MGVSTTLSVDVERPARAMRRGIRWGAASGFRDPSHPPERCSSSTDVELICWWCNLVDLAVKQDPKSIGDGQDLCEPSIGADERKVLG